MRGVFPQQMRSIAKEMDVPLERIGLPNSMFSASYGIGKFFTSLASDYVPCSEFHALGLMLSGVAVAALGFCPGFGALAVLWGLQGIVQAFGWPFVGRIVVTKLPAADRAKYWGLLSMACNVGNMLAPYGIVAAGAVGLSWRGSFIAAGVSAVVVSAIVWWLLCCGSAGALQSIETIPESSAAEGEDDLKKAKKHEDDSKPKMSSWAGSLAMLSLMGCNMLSFGSSKCIKEWAPVYLRNTGLASSELEVATLIFWSEVGGSAGAVAGGFVSSRLGGRHSLTCVLSALIASSSLGTLLWCCWASALDPARAAPMSFPVACALQALALAGVNGVRTLAGLHGAELAAFLGRRVGATNAWLEAVGQIGSVCAGQPLGALAAFAVSTLVAHSSFFIPPSSSGQTGLDSPIAGTTIIGVLTIASVIMVMLNVALLPQEALRLSHKAKVE
eukprot:CAMPEP_0206436672 /NCGR_PEP_ID=MMETSP0324_2-20121206/10615_1 /ASSEMBLY_ACC=CAM_ASM_000836 /TAXON_ID=2866 /ORGANISM="Crypthecodinium cohnii, Strain Seligo" /LENGTH=443 /DNA_ID=CAMNT_0053903867 /DNA_START=315 /DNA_END=1646 /DNA_ORIENTATION=+